tara:strand:- start:4983 stop:5840 length:858 start_codon:yes stop_codon:yes gene_type:complete
MLKKIIRFGINKIKGLVFKTKKVINYISPTEFKYRKFVKAAQFDKSHSNKKDRELEVMAHFNFDDEKLKEVFSDVLAYKKVESEFMPDLSDDDKLLDYYTGRYVKGVVSHMLRYDRYRSAFAISNFFKKYHSGKKLNMLDFGCGVGDFSVSIAPLTKNLTVCDLKDGNIDFADWRLERRNVKHDKIEVSIENMYPDFSKLELDLVVAGDVLEHVRYPKKTLESMLSGLNEGGYLWLSAYPFTDCGLRGDHLEEPYHEREEIKNYVLDKFILIEDKCLSGYLLKKK